MFAMNEIRMLLQNGSGTSPTYSSVLRGEGFGERPPHFQTFLACFLMFTGPVPGHLLAWHDPLFSFFSLPRKTCPVPARPVFKGLWECKVTPAYCTCQERNTTGCILNNDGLGAGVTVRFSTRGIHGAFTNVGEGLGRLSFRVGWVTWQETGASKGAVDLESGDG